MKFEDNLENMYKIFEDTLDDIYMQLEGDILTINDEDKNYIKRTNMDMNLKTEEFEKFIKNNCDIPKENLDKITDKIQSFKEDIYDYMVYFVRKGFKIGFKNGAKLVIRDGENGNRN